MSLDKPAFNPAAFDTTPKVAVHENPKPTVFTPAAAMQALEDEAKAEAAEVVELRELPLGPLTNWSFSGLMQFESCPQARYLARVKNCPDPSGPAADRGSKLHEAIEDYIQGKCDDLDKDVKKFRLLIEDLRNRFPDGNVSIEGEWGFNRNWEVIDYNADDVWTRGKLDALVFEDDTSAWIIDWKSGKKWGNEMKHGQQLQLYAIYTFLRNPQLEFVRGEMIYIDKGERMTQTYTRKQALRFMDIWDRRGNKMTTAKNFPAKPNMVNCRWCAFGKIQEGQSEPACSSRYEA